jgi:hypothetical protein
VRNVLWVGTDDGNVQRSADGGRTWTEFSGKIAGLPRSAWINGIEASRHADGRAYLVANNYRAGDNANYVYVTDDNGASWRRIDGGLPANRVARTLREDLVNPDVLYLGTEFGLYWSNDRGRTWAELRAGMPMMAHNDLFIHPREHDLVLGTHSRGIWIVDNVRALRELTPQVASSALHVFSTRPAEQIRYRSELGHVGDMFYNGTNPPAGGLVDFWLATAAPATVTFTSAQGETVATLAVTGRAGVNRAVWDLTYREEGAATGGRGAAGPLVVPGTYTVTVTSGGHSARTTLEVREDPRLQVAPALRAAWTASLQELATLRRDAQALATRSANAARQATDADRARLEEHRRETGELAARANRLYGEVRGAVGPLTAQQRSQLAYYREMLGVLGTP